MSTLKQIIQRTPVKDFQLGIHLKDYKRDQRLTKAELEAMIQAGPIWFAVAEVGNELQLVEPAQCIKFWKTEVKPHLTDGLSRLEDFPDEYLYFTSRWVAEGTRPIILLEKHH